MSQAHVIEITRGKSPSPRKLRSTEGGRSWAENLQLWAPWGSQL